VLDAVGVRFPAALVLIRKVMFTLDGVLNDIAGDDVRIDTVIAREFITRWVRGWGTLPSPLTWQDCLSIQRSALRYLSGAWALPVEEPRLSLGQAAGDRRVT
jgi:hypothetical protein